MDNKIFNDRYNFAPKIFKYWMKGKLDLADSTILDFGCDTGVMSLGLVHHCAPKLVIGVDINANHNNLLAEASRHMDIDELPENIKFYVTSPNENLSDYFSKRTKIDCIFSWSVFEHVSQPILKKMATELYKTVRQGGYAFIQIAPLYYSAFGSHLDMLIPEPWAHLTTQLNLFQNYVLNADKVGPYADEDDGNFEKIKVALWSTYATLNKITADELIGLFTSSGFTLIDQFRSPCKVAPSASLTAVYNKDMLTTEQVVGLFKKV